MNGANPASLRCTSGKLLDWRQNAQSSSAPKFISVRNEPKTEMGGQYRYATVRPKARNPLIQIAFTDCAPEMASRCYATGSDPSREFREPVARVSRSVNCPP